MTLITVAFNFFERELKKKKFRYAQSHDHVVNLLWERGRYHEAKPTEENQPMNEPAVKADIRPQQIKGFVQ